jgi:hypothetical protein
MYATPNTTGIWDIKTNPFDHSCFDSTIRADHNQMNTRMIANIINNRLRENLEMTNKEARDLVK